MSIYMLQAAYTAQAWQNLVTKPEDRRVAIGGVVKAAGGRLLDLYFVFGENDLVAIFEAPDPISAAAVSVAANIAGHVKSIKTTQLLTVEDSLELMRRTASLGPAQPPAGATGVRP